MRFSNKREEFVGMVETVALTLSLGAVFLQIWILLTAVEAYLNGDFKNLLPSVLLSALAFMACGLSVYLTKIQFAKGITQGRSKTYQNKST